MSTQFAPRTISIDRDLLDDVINCLHRDAVTFVRADDEYGPRLRVAPANAADLARAITEARASKEEEAQKRLEEARASVSVGGLSVEQAERLIALVKDAPASVKREVADQVPDDLRQALGITDPEHEATIVVRFRRQRRPSNYETKQWVQDALAYYFNEVEAYCGRTDSDSEDYPDADDHILDVTVREIVSLGD